MSFFSQGPFTKQTDSQKYKASWMLKREREKKKKTFEICESDDALGKVTSTCLARFKDRNESLTIIDVIAM